MCVDTGIGRVGVPFREAAPLIRDLAARKSVEIAGTMMTFTEDETFDREELGAAYVLGVDAGEQPKAIEQALGAFRGLSVPKLTAAPARVLRSVNAPAVAIEIGSFAPDTDATLFTSSSFQQQLAGAILNGLDNFKKP